LRQWDQDKIQAMLGGIEFMHKGVMPPFAGTDAERAALAAYLSTVQPVSATAAAAASDGGTVFEQNCSMCHQVSAGTPLFKTLAKDPKAAVAALKDLTSVFAIMPDLKLSEPQRIALVEWINAHRGMKGPANAAPGGS
jgi:mono/diheme cytochrome c family protein